MPYIVRVYDNFHYMDEDEAFDLPALASAEEALARCKAIVDRSLQELRCEGMSADALYTRYQMFGDDPVVIASGGAPDVFFSGWCYAQTQAAALVDANGPTAARLIC